MTLISEFPHLLKSAFADFRRDKIRTALTSLGIMIGVMSVVLLIAVGLGLKNYISSQFENLGANLVMILPGSGFSGGGAGIVGGAEFDEQDFRNVSRVEGIKYIVPLFMKSTVIETEENSEKGYIMGVNEQMFDLLNYDLVEGKIWTKNEITSRSKSVVIGNVLAEKLFTNINTAIGKTIRVEGLRLKVIGVNKKTGDNEQDRSVTIPYTTTFGSLNPKKTFFSLYLGITDKDQISSVSREAEKTLLKRYKKDQFTVTQQSEILSTVDQIFGMINLVLMAIGSISLLVGGIGIMNIMYATVTERTKEVGIRRAIGATKRDILLQFLTESTVLSLFGGVTGLIASALIVLLVRIWFPVALNGMAVMIAFGVSSAIGIFFGVFPAKKAADLSPIDAIRYE